MAPRFGYWNLQGLGQASRLLLAFTGTEHEDEVLDIAHREVWMDKKFNLGLDFPNLPYYIDQDVKLTQSNAILRYLGRKNNLYGKNAIEAGTIDMLIDEAQDIKMALIKTATSPDFENVKGDHIKAMEQKLKIVSDFLGNKKFFMGDEVTIGDFAMIDALSWHQIFDADLMGKFPNLVAFIDNFKALDKIKAFYEGPKHFKLVLPPMFPWHGQ
uniref:glutathione transferase n=1 Tax=Paracyclopina nana TaxID=565004 RepID=H2B645_PARNA